MKCQRIPWPPNSPHLRTGQRLTCSHSHHGGSERTWGPEPHHLSTPSTAIWQKLEAQTGLGEFWHVRGETKGKWDLPGLWLSGSCNFCPGTIAQKVGLVERMKQSRVGLICWQPDRWGDWACPSFVASSCLCSNLSGLLVQEKDHTRRSLSFWKPFSRLPPATLTVSFPRVST